MEQAVPFVVWYKWVVLAMTILVVWLYYPLSGRSSQSSSYLFFLAVCYPLGKTFQAFGLGPGFVRWYLSDLGFVPFLAVHFGLVSVAKRGTLYSNQGYEKGVVAGLTIALVVEWMQLVAASVGKSGLTRGDFNDVMLYITSASLSMLWIQKSRLTQTS